MSKNTAVPFSFTGFLIVLVVAVALFAPSGIGQMVSFGKTHTDEFCKECGAFRKADYFTLFVQSFETESEPYIENGIQKLHDAFFPPCKDHKWCVFHTGRANVRFKGNREPYPKIGFEILKRFENKKNAGFHVSQAVIGKSDRIYSLRFCEAWKQGPPFVRPFHGH